MNAKGLMLIGWCVLLSVAGGCTREYWEEDLAASGLVIILPGIQGEDELSYDIRDGLIRGGVRRALVIQPWGNPAPVVGLAINQVNFVGARIDAAVIAGKILAYQNQFPDQPVSIIGHSGGGAVAVFISENLQDQHGQPVDSIVLLSPSISSIYDVTKALAGTRKGILNCYNPSDIALLAVGTTVVGNLDGMHAPSAGLNGFTAPLDIDRPAKKQAYTTKLFQQQVATSGDPHTASTHVAFVAGAPAKFILGDPVTGRR